MIFKIKFSNSKDMLHLGLTGEFKDFIVGFEI